MPEHRRTGPFPQHAPSLHRCRRETRQHRFLLAPPITGAAVRALVHHTPPHQQPLDAPVDRLDQAVHLLIRRRRGSEKAQPAPAVLHIDTVEHERMDVDVQIQRRAETLDDGHGPTATSIGPRLPRPAPQRAQHRAHEDATTARHNA
jgi:hypothetical protein